MPTHPTTCRICEAACGLLAEVEDHQVRALRPDPDHPISSGYACAKGTHFAGRVQHSPDRVVTPRWGGQPVSWDLALAKIGSALTDLLARHGPDAVGIYSGNAAGHSLGAVLGITALQRALGTPKHYSCLTLDNSEMFVVAEAVFGSPMATFVADYAASDAIVLFGTDPIASQASQSQSHPRASADLRRRREGLVVVDPRRSATARMAVEHLQPRVGTDVFLLAWLVGRAAENLGSDGPALAAATAPFDLQRVSRVTGLPAASIEGLWDRLRRARAPLVWSGLGVLLSPHGTLGWWLTVALQSALGGLGRTWRWQPGAVDLGRWLSRLGVRGTDPEVRSPVGDWPAILGTLPAATLADDILRDDEDALRALIVIGGDPRSSLPASTRAAQALDHLELLVCIDLFETPTARHAHALLPAATWLERAETGLHTVSQRPTPFLRLDPPVVPPRGEAREDWQICLDLCGAAGRPPFGSRLAQIAIAAGLSPTTVARAALAMNGVGWSDVVRGTFSAVRTPMPKAMLAVPWLCDALSILPDPAPGLRLLTTVRHPAAMNHWLRPRAAVVARAHPDDHPGGRARLVGPGGSLEVQVATDSSLPQGTVVLPFGDAACNPNHLVGSTHLEPFSGQPWSNGTRVHFEA